MERKIEQQKEQLLETSRVITEERQAKRRISEDLTSQLTNESEKRQRLEVENAKLHTVYNNTQENNRRLSIENANLVEAVESKSNEVRRLSSTIDDKDREIERQEKVFVKQLENKEKVIKEAEEEKVKMIEAMRRLSTIAVHLTDPNKFDHSV